jgi:hypothetical protein
MEGRPTVTRKVRTTREVRFTLSVDEHAEAVVNYLRRHYAEFRGFANDELEIDWNTDGTVQLHALKELQS